MKITTTTHRPLKRAVSTALTQTKAKEAEDSVTLSSESGPQKFNIPNLSVLGETAFAAGVGALAGAIPIIGAAHSFSGAVSLRKKSPALAVAGLLGTVANIAGTYALAQGDFTGAIVGLGLSSAAVAALMLGPC